MILVDTNVFSALMRLERELEVSAWLDLQARDTLLVSAPTIFEVHHGITRLPEGKRRRELELRYADVMADVFNTSVLPLDARAAELAGRLHAEQIARGRNADVQDSQIAGVALSLGAAVATRDIDDFKGLGIPLINPWCP